MVAMLYSHYFCFTSYHLFIPAEVLCTVALIYFGPTMVVIAIDIQGCYFTGVLIKQLATMTTQIEAKRKICYIINSLFSPLRSCLMQVI